MTLNCNGKILDLSTKKIMGIVNVSKDSFYDGGMYNTVEKVIKRISVLNLNGADIIDLGGASSKPGSKLISPEEELNIVSKYIKALKNHFSNTLFSIDTYNSNVAEYALNNGFAIVNDISSGRYDRNMYNVVKSFNAGYISMHMKGDPINMQEDPKYDNVIDSIIFFFKSKIEELENQGISNLIIDPGFGFGKTIDNNYEILKKLYVFKSLNKPLMVGLSRKSMIYKVLKKTPEESLNGTTVLNTIALNNGADILRVHDVKQAVECRNILEKLN